MTRKKNDAHSATPPPPIDWLDRFFIGGLHRLERATIPLLGLVGASHRRHPTEHGKLAAYEWRSNDPSHSALPPIALIHGYNAQAFHYTPLARLLLDPARQPLVSRVLLPDLLGHGQSDPPADHRNFARPMYDSLATLLNREFSAERPGILMGNSLGGWLSLQYALDHPERLKALILISPAGPPISPETHEKFVRTFRFRNLGEAARFYRNLHGLPRPIQSVLFAPGVRATFKRPWIHHLGDDLDAEYFLKAEAVQALRVPTQLIWGRREAILPREMFLWFREHLPGARLEIAEPETFGHCPQFDHPRELVKLMTDFVRAAGN